MTFLNCYSNKLLSDLKCTIKYLYQVCYFSLLKNTRQAQRLVLQDFLCIHINIHVYTLMRLGRSFVMCLWTWALVAAIERRYSFLATAVFFWYLFRRSKHFLCVLSSAWWDLNGLWSLLRSLDGEKEGGMERERGRIRERKDKGEVGWSVLCLLVHHTQQRVTHPLPDLVSASLNLSLASLHFFSRLQ